ncbi:hypothetical protein GCM10010910_13130 [Microbacterium nanhaiense]|uniref:Uncharacterized protein n=1 Tax=Microbacterium nanhaiense TaxID=1301026 RepID=A0ABQ2N0Z5_9MICO|nr:hypothetical protein GCM10010910_13130 [Microbacterium nanhaiense]
MLRRLEVVAADDPGVHLSPADLGAERPREQELRVDDRIRHSRARQHIGCAAQGVAQGDPLSIRRHEIRLYGVAAERPP